jgi:phosphopantothenoylcysteine synthetase/decarboxylase
MDEGWSVCVIPTPQAAGWIDATALAEQTGYPVRHDYRQPGDSKSLPPAEAIVVAPATFNTINKWAAGISDNYALGILNEAVGLGLCLVAAPYAKVSLAAHPVFKENLNRIESYGASILPNEIIRQDQTNSTPSQGYYWKSVVDTINKSIDKGDKFRHG